MTLLISEAERQVLIALVELAEPIETPNNTHDNAPTASLSRCHYEILSGDTPAAYN